jgi:hypothetical protein
MHLYLTTEAEYKHNWTIMLGFVAGLSPDYSEEVPALVIVLVEVRKENNNLI